ncbi:MAG: hypothetical protein ACRBBP_05100 [Bdellovibrionales bacterium]
MKRNDAFKRIAVSLALISFLGCNSNKGEKKKLNKQIAEAEAANAQSVSVIKDYEARIAQLEKEEAALILEAANLEAQQTKWADDRADRLLQIKALDVQIEKLSEELRALSANRANLERLVAAEQSKLEVKKIEIAEAERGLQAEIEKQKAVVLQANADANRIRSSARAQGAAIVSAAQEEAEKALVDAAAKVETAEKELTRLEAVEAALVSDRKELEAEEARLALFSSELAQQKIAIESAEQTLAEERAKFANQVEAARKLFLESGKEKIFEGLEAGKNYPFMISVVGTGDYSVLEKIRADILKKTSSNKYGKHNMMNPLTADTTEVLSEADARKVAKNSSKDSGIISSGPEKEVRLQDGRWYIEDVQGSDSVNVRDAFLMDANIETIVGIEEAINKAIGDTYAKADGVEGANFWVSVRPVVDVEVSAEIAIFGSKGYGSNSKVSLVSKSNVDPKRINLAELAEVDLTDLSKNIFGDSANGCSIIDSKCLSFLKSKGMLSGIDKDGVSLEDKITSSIEASIRKIELETMLGSDSTAPYLPTVWGKDFWGRVTLEVDPVKKQELLNERAALTDEKDALSKEETIQFITLSLKVKSIFEVGEGRVTTDASELMNLGSVINGAINNDDVSERGVIEIDVPVRGGNFAKSELPLLSMTDFESSQAAPVPPEALKPVDEQSDAEYAATLQAEEAYRTELTTYRTELAAYNVTLAEEKAEEYKDRLKELQFQLETMKRTLEE